jgi:hypothetical protein
LCLCLFAFGSIWIEASVFNLKEFNLRYKKAHYSYIQLI